MPSWQSDGLLAFRPLDDLRLAPISTLLQKLMKLGTWRNDVAGLHPNLVEKWPSNGDLMGIKWDWWLNLEIPSGKLTVGPWKQWISIGNWSSNPHLPGSMLIYWMVYVVVWHMSSLCLKIMSSHIWKDFPSQHIFLGWGGTSNWKLVIGANYRCYIPPSLR